MARSHLLILLVAAVCASGCMSTEDYLNDLYEVQRSSDGTLPLDVYDAGQLAHEALSGLVQEKEFTLSQMGRGIAYAGRAADNSEVALIRGQGLALLAHLANVYPVPPVDRKLESGNASRRRRLVSEQTVALRTAIDRLSAGRILIPLLRSPDQADVERALTELKKTTGQDFGRDIDGWRSWWDANEKSFEASVAVEAVEPIRILGNIQYPSLRMAHLVLQLITTSLTVADLPALRDETEKAILTVGRQVIELAIAKSLATEESPIVRGEAAGAAVRVLAPSFGEAITTGILTTDDQNARMRLIRALRYYPAKQTMMTLLLCLRDERPVVRYSACDVLSHHSGENLEADFAAWRLWWEREGLTRWP